jgi:hypothetical protein
MVTAMGITAFAADTYAVAGDKDLCNGINWDPAAAENELTDDGDGTWSIEFKNVKAGTYGFKITTNDKWDIGDYNLEGDAKFGGTNATVKVEKDGSTVVIGFDGTKAIIEKVEAPEGEDPTSEQKEDPTTTPAPAKTKEVNVRVKLDSSLKWEVVKLYAWAEGGDPVEAWPGVTLTKDGEYYTAKIKVPADADINMIVNNGAGGDGNQTGDIKKVDISTGAVDIAVAADLTATVTPKTGDATPIVPIIATMLALGCAVVILNAKKANR